ncbi:hypothetical protein [Polaromonas hydrogenivorans]|uniref:Uncharacterized protein n=1 Tax=Polaromonas hydrogenivorans TaxID=335476 RepID=A0AAU7LZX9_9BURK
MKMTCVVMKPGAQLAHYKVSSVVISIMIFSRLACWFGGGFGCWYCWAFSHLLFAQQKITAMSG